SPVYWNQYANYSVFGNDAEGNKINITLWISNDLGTTWYYAETKTINSGNYANFSILLDKDYIGFANKYKFEYSDVNDSFYNISQYSNTSVYDGPTVNKHKTNITHFNGNGSIINNTNHLVVGIYDALVNDLISDGTGVKCNLHIDTVYETFVWMNTSGYCVFNAITASVGEHNWSVNTTITSYYDTNTSINYALYIAGNITADVVLNVSSPGPVYRYNTSAENNSIQWNMTNITDSHNSINNTYYYILWDGQVIESSQANSTGLNSTFDIPDNAAVGNHMFSIYMNHTENYIHERYYNYTYFVKGLANATIITQNNSIVYLANSSGYPNATVNLTVNITDEYNNVLNAIPLSNITFNKPDGTCLLKTNNLDGTYTCQYYPGEISIGYYIWNATIDSPDHTQITSENSYIYVGANLTAGVSLYPQPSGPVYKNNTISAVNKTIYFNITDIKYLGKDENPKSNVDAVNYTVYFNNSIVGEGQCNSAGVNSSFNISSDLAPAIKEMKVYLQKDNFLDFNRTYDYDVYGSLNITVLTPNETILYEVNTSILLKANLTDENRDEVIDAVVNFTVLDASGDCITQGYNSTGHYYYCYYNLSLLSIGNYTWNANVSKSHYRTNKSENYTFSLNSLNYEPALSNQTV
ncbi:MAG: hypothetical protein KAQ92_04695, partial [Candidatus Aenigmarchaeota archaeon]|nr:hypothetical protein [Candidatus Aenigmarchaeota archaeon]